MEVGWVEPQTRVAVRGFTPYCGQIVTVCLMMYTLYCNPSENTLQTVQSDLYLIYIQFIKFRWHSLLLLKTISALQIHLIILVKSSKNGFFITAINNPANFNFKCIFG
jgi:hypothetical protein